MLEVDERKGGRKPSVKRPSSDLVAGTVVRARGHHYDVRTEEGGVFLERMCQVRGRLLQEKNWGTLVAVGDRVWVSPVGEKQGQIERIEDRRSVLSRQDPAARVASEDVIIANPDQVLIVFASAQPEPHLRMLDRFLVLAEANELPVVICANKVDLVGLEVAREIFGEYEKIGYSVVYASAVDGSGVEELRKLLQDRITVLAGPSGVGKSSVLNSIHPLLNLRTGDLRAFMHKGKHTTRSAQLLHLPIGEKTFVADTPGMRELGLYDIDPANLQFYFVEMEPYLLECRYPGCRHDREPGCAVRAAVEEGVISQERYESYLRLLRGEE
jgi:ribosome biogenesis GTPase